MHNSNPKALGKVQRQQSFEERKKVFFISLLPSWDRALGFVLLCRGEEWLLSSGPERAPAFWKDSTACVWRSNYAHLCVLTCHRLALLCIKQLPYTLGLWAF